MKSVNVQETRVVFLRPEHIEEATKLIVNSFMTMNSLWTKIGCTYEEVFSVLRGKVIVCQTSGISIVLIKNNKIIGVTLNVDLVDYLSWQTMPNEAEIFKFIAPYAKKLESQYFKSLSFKRGEYFFGFMSAIDENHANGGVTFRFWIEGWCLARSMGCKYGFVRISNIYAGKLFEKFGGKLVNVIQIEHPEIKGEKFQLMSIDIQNVNIKSYTDYFRPSTSSILQ